MPSFLASGMKASRVSATDGGEARSKPAMIAISEDSPVVEIVELSNVYSVILCILATFATKLRHILHVSAIIDTTLADKKPDRDGSEANIIQNHVNFTEETF